MMRWMKWALTAMAALAIPATAQSPTQLQPTKTTVAVLPTQAPAKTGGPASAHELTQADVDAWLDGFMPYALKAGGIPGAVVVVVKDGQPVTMRGFGYADVKARKPVDPNLTLFRPGSVSKLFTWTAVMQQVQAGKIDLDKDINTYLDFKIPEKFGKPITMRHLMTHTAGFAETAKYLINFDKQPPQALDKALSRWVPERIYAPGAMHAYSNYGASLAGYIVQRVSGEPFNQYIQRHILQPAGMQHSTFDQPLPARFAPIMSQGYEYGSDKLQAVVNQDGSVKMFSITPFAPIIEFLPAPASLNAGWISPVAGIALLVMFVAALGWPIVALIRRRYNYSSPLSGRSLSLHRATRVTAWLFILLLVGWLGIVMAIDKDLTALNGGMDGWMRLLQLLLIVAIAGTVLAIWNAYGVVRAPGRHRIASIWAILIALSAAFLAWLALDLGLLTASLNY